MSHIELHHIHQRLRNMELMARVRHIIVGMRLRIIEQKIDAMCAGSKDPKIQELTDRLNAVVKSTTEVVDENTPT